MMKLELRSSRVRRGRVIRVWLLGGLIECIPGLGCVYPPHRARVKFTEVRKGRQERENSRT